MDKKEDKKEEQPPAVKQDEKRAIAKGAVNDDKTEGEEAKQIVKEKELKEAADAKAARVETKGKRRGEPAQFDINAWQPKTELGRKVKSGAITSISTIIESGQLILEPEIVDALVPNLENDLLLIGQSRGKFGGGQRRVFKQTQKKTREGNKPHFGTLAVVGNRDGIIGIGTGRSKDTVPSREKAFRRAKLNIINVRRGSGSWQSKSLDPTSIPFSVEGKCGNVKLRLIPAPKGAGLRIEKECSKILQLAGIKDIYSQRIGQTRTKGNLIKACFDALKKLNMIKVTRQEKEQLGIVDGMLPRHETPDSEEPPAAVAEASTVTIAATGQDSRAGQQSRTAE